MGRELLDMDIALVTPGALLVDTLESDPEHGRVMLQEINEERYSRKHVDAKIRKELAASDLMQAKIAEGVELVNAYIGQHYTYVTKEGVKKDFDSKNKRVAQLKDMDVKAMVEDLLVGIAYVLRPELFTSVTAQLAARLKFSDRTTAIQTVAELCAVLCQTDAFDIDKPSKMASLELVSRIPLSEGLVRFIEYSQFLPPMVCEPLELTHNFSSGYLTHNDSLILGSGNHHDGDICLDVLNLMNRVPLQLDTQFLSQVEEMPSHELDSPEKQEQWDRFKKQSYYFYSLMQQQGNRFHFNHKVDKRGRAYCQGYHISPQGSPFKKAMLEFCEEEVVEGVPGL